MGNGYTGNERIIFRSGVSIINDTVCVWVTGEIHNDSTDIQTPNGCMLPYFNAARWDGQIWHYYRIRMGYMFSNVVNTMYF